MKTIYATPETKLQKLFDSLQPDTEVVLSEGVFRQKCVLAVPNVTLRGCGDKTVISFDDFAKKTDSDGVEIGTFKSYTLAVVADGVTLRDLTVENTSGNPKELGQQVALSVCGSNFSAQHCTFVSTQDTLFCGPLPDDLVVRYDNFLPDCLRIREGMTFQKYRNCKIVGTVDFIFGCANALFENCEIVSVGDGRDVGYVAAPAHPLANDIGFLFLNCNLVADCAPTVYLARAWRDFGKATFICCTYGNHIHADGFVNWQGTERQRTARFAEYCQQHFVRAEWTKRLSEEAAQAFVVKAKPFFNF